MSCEITRRQNCQPSPRVYKDALKEVYTIETRKFLLVYVTHTHTLEQQGIKVALASAQE